ncbi:MAG: proton-conducting transporter membrane subunit, partial [Pseudomonadota bacterium]
SIGSVENVRPYVEDRIARKARIMGFGHRVYKVKDPRDELQFIGFALPLAVFAILIASAVALFEPQLKRMLAWSSVAQIGYIMLGASLLSESGLTAAIVHLFNHGLAKLALFLVVAGFATRAPTLTVSSLAGLGRQMPWTAAAFALAGLSLIGVPGTAGFISKWYLLLAVLDKGAAGIALIAVIAAGSLLAVAYVWRVVEAAFFAPAPADESSPASEFSMLLLVTWAAVLGNLYFGVFSDVPVGLAGAAAELLLEHRP